MITDRDESRYRNDNGGRDGNSSSRKTQGEETAKKKRPRVGDTRTPISRNNNNNNNYSSNDEDNNGGYNRNRSNSGGSGYRQSSGQRSNNNRGGGGYTRRDGNSGGYNNSGGGYNNNRSNSGGGYKRNNQGGGGYSSSEPRKTFAKKKVLIRPVKYKENIDPSTPIRLNKYLANAGVCSRREADAFITAGAVKVNGEVISELGAKVTRGDSVTFHDQPVTLESKIYVLLNKPKNVVTTSDDPQNRKTVMDLVKNACTERIYPVGRLDRNTTGVLLLTNDGDLASKLMHPKFKKKKIYQVKLDRDVTMEDMQAIADGIELDDGEIHADSIAYVGEDVLDEVGIEIHSGRNRIVRRIFEKLGYHVMKLDRVYFAGLTKKNIPRGRWRYLTEKEVNMLRMGAYE